MAAPILIVSGSPGVGKSTVAGLIAKRFERSAVVRGDDFHDYLATGVIPPHLPESHEQNIVVIGVTVRAAAGYAAGGWTTVLEGIIGPWFLEPAIEAAAQVDAELHYAHLHAPIDECVARFVQREGGSDRVEIVTKMHGEFVEHMLTDHVIDATASPEAVGDEVLRRYQAGELLLG